MKIETDIDYIKKQNEEQTKKLNEFIDCADKRYTHKIEFDEFRKEIKEGKASAGVWARWAPGVVLSIVAILIAILK